MTETPPKPRDVPHESVLLAEVLEALDPQPGDIVIDGTVDGGGHAAALAEKIGKKGMLIGIDQDPEMLALSRARFGKIGTKGTAQVILAEGNYADAKTIMEANGVAQADCLLLDLGFSSAQLTSGRGFSFMENDPLMMTYSPNDTPVSEIVNGMREDELADIIFKYGEERMSRRIAKAIVEARRKQKIVTTGDLTKAIRSALPKSYERGRIDPSTRTFQALRIYANHEFENIDRVIRGIPEMMKPGARVAVITFHSLEDRIVKQAFQKLEKEESVARITKKPIIPSREELVRNPRSRSAKLRAITLIP